MKVVVVGGGLQGIEATYLAQQCGWQVILLDKNPLAPATGLCDIYYQLDVTVDAADELINILNKADFIIPALENNEALTILKNIKEKIVAPIAFDVQAYGISSSKIKSNRLFESLNIPMPKLWPNCNFPVIVKPTNASGSQGVSKVLSEAHLYNLTGQKNFNAGNWVIQEYVAGPSFSIEVVGVNHHYGVIQVTDLQMDSSYDCKRVLAPSALALGLQSTFQDIALQIAKGLNLTGIMDVEVILHEGELKVLEIDARLPSQTPTAVLKSTGINILELLAQIYIEKKKPSFPMQTSGKSVIYEHIKIQNDTLEVTGE
ncbi:MAG: 3-methylornithine--L-lysine ligase PylC, partial [Clostridia bacterium]|nr:3-methylornithine--L-lysine ligase PylC [Clostridia bacterium]